MSQSWFSPAVEERTQPSKALATTLPKGRLAVARQPQLPDVIAWPHLPAGCPPPAAALMVGTFYRLIDGNKDDWKTHAMLRGADSYPLAVGACRWNSLSVFSTIEEAQKYRETYKALKRKVIARFYMTMTMGYLLQDKPPGAHHDWWPGASFQPPPVHEILADAAGG